MITFCLTARSENSQQGYGFYRSSLKIAFFGLKSGQDLKNLATHPHEEFPGVPPQAKGIYITFFLESVFLTVIKQFLNLFFKKQ